MTKHVELVKQFEGLRLDAYTDSVGVWTIGYGHTGPDVKPGMKIGQETADKLLDDDLDWAEAAVRKAVKVPLNEGRYAALVSFVFNVGAANFQKSTLLRKLNSGDYIGAANEFSRWNKGRDRATGELRVIKGLTRRREMERAIFMEADVATPETVEAPGDMTTAVIIGAVVLATLALFLVVVMTVSGEQSSMAPLPKPGN